MKLDLHHKLFLAFIAWCAIGTLCSDYFLMSLKGFYPYRGEGLITYLIITCLAFSYWKAFDSINALSWFCLSSCAVMTGYFYYHVPFYGDKFLMFDTPSFLSNNFDVVFLPGVAISAFACLAGILVMQIHPALSIICFFPILNSGSRSAIGGLLIAWIICFLLIRTKKPSWDHRKPYFKLSTFSKRGLITIICILIAWVIMEKSYYFEQRFENLPSLSQIGHGPRSQWLLQAQRLSQMIPFQGYGLDTLSNYLQTPRIKGFEDVMKYIPDKTHSFVYDIILQTGWIGLTLLLLSFGYALGIAMKHPNKQNWVCICTIFSFGIFGCLNPHGLLAESVALTSFFGIRKT